MAGGRASGREWPRFVDGATACYSAFLWMVLRGGPVLPAEQHPVVDGFVESWEQLRDEYDELAHARPAEPLSSVLTGHERLSGDSGWRVAILRVFNNDVGTYHDRCRVASALLDDRPDVVTAMYSVLDPHTEVGWHPGVMKGVVRCHVPLRVPEGDVGFQVGRRRTRWVPGQPFLFDDSYLHRAWNRTDEPRSILILDVVRPMPWKWLDRLNRWVVGRLGRTRRFRATAARAGGARPLGGEPAVSGAA